jgi:hypothetical protein
VPLFQAPSTWARATLRVGTIAERAKVWLDHLPTVPGFLAPAARLSKGFPLLS